MAKKQSSSIRISGGTRQMPKLTGKVNPPTRVNPPTGKTYTPGVKNPQQHKLLRKPS